MKKSLIAIMVVLSIVCSMFASPFAEEPTEEKCDLGSGVAGNTTGWWCTGQDFVSGVCAVAFTAPKAFSAMEIGMSCGTNAPVNFTLYRYIDSTEDTLTRRPLWSDTVIISGNHNSENDLIRCDFDKVYGAGRYVFAVRYGAEEYVDKQAYFVVNSTGPCQDPSLDVEVFVRNLNANELTQEGILCRLVLSNAEPEYKPEDEPVLEYVDFSSGAVDTGWFCDQPQNVPGYFAVAFTSPNAFTGMEFAMYCGTNAPVKFSLYRYENTLDDTLSGEPIWTESRKISGNHIGPNSAQYVNCHFDSIIEAGRYAFKIEYDAPEFIDGAYFVVGTAETPNADLDIEQTFSALGVGPAALAPNATFAGRLETVKTPDPEYLEFFTGTVSTGWWCSDQAHLSGYYAVAFTSPSNFTGMELAMYCGTNVPVKFSLYQYKDSIEKSLAGAPAWTESRIISDNHVGPGRENYVICDFDMVLGAGRYVFKIEYDADEYDIYAHFVVGAAASSGNADLDIEIAAPGLNVSPLEADATFAGRLVITDAAAPKPAFSGASLTLYNDLAIKYMADKSQFETEGFSNPYVIFEFNGKKITVDSFTVEGDQYVFCFRNIAPDQMNDTILATLYATYKGVEYAGETKAYSVSEYCYNTLEKYNSEAYAKLRTLLVDLLHYGAQSQKYTGRNTENPVDAKLTEEQRAWGTSEDPVLTSVFNKAHETVPNPLVTWEGASLTLYDSVSMRFLFTTEEAIEELTLKIVGEKSEWSISPDNFVLENGVYFVRFSGLNAGQMSEKVYLTMYKGDAAVSDTVCYSIESYACAKQNSDFANLADLVKAMMKYGNAAYAYVNN